QLPGGTVITDTDYTGVGMIETTTSPDHAFRLGLGHPVLEFLATLASRRGEPFERLATPEDFSRWLELAGLASGVRCDRKLLAQTRELREAMYRIIAAARDGHPPAAADLEPL